MDVQLSWEIRGRGMLCSRQATRQAHGVGACGQPWICGPTVRMERFLLLRVTQLEAGDAVSSAGHGAVLTVAMSWWRVFDVSIADAHSNPWPVHRMQSHMATVLGHSAPLPWDRNYLVITRACAGGPGNWRAE